MILCLLSLLHMSCSLHLTSFIQCKSNAVSKCHNSHISSFSSSLLVKTNKINRNHESFQLYSSETQQDDVDNTSFDLASWFNPSTRGGVITWSSVLIIIPIIIYNYLISTGIEDVQVGAYVGASFVLISNLLWASTYIFRVANKDMTYAKQLRDYENAVLQKRLEELGDDEITALMDEISRDDENIDVVAPVMTTEASTVSPEMKTPVMSEGESK